MLRGAGGFWILRGLFRGAGRTAKSIDKAIPGAGWINAASIVVGLLAAAFLSALLAPLGGFFLVIGYGLGLLVGWGFNSWMLSGLAGIARAHKAWKDYEK
jgi:hypothetical protein